MKKTTLSILVAMALMPNVMVAAARADDTAAAGACYTISDPDARNYCRAKARHDSSTCYAIQRQDLRAMCLSETRK